MVEDAGFITRQSRNAVSETLQRLEGALASRGFMVFCRIDHGAAAAAIGETLPPRTVLLYGNPQIGTAAMARFPTLAIDLPAKLLVWQDDAGRCGSPGSAAAISSARSSPARRRGRRSADRCL